MPRVIDEVLWDRRTGWLATRWFPVLVVCAMAGALVGSPLLSGGAEAWGYDYRAFRAGAEMTLSGELAAAYDPDRFAARLGHPDKPMYWMYAPHGSMLLAPLGLGPWWLGGAMLFLSTAGAAYGIGFAVGGGRREGALVLCAGLPVLFALMLGQAAPVFGALLAGALWILPRRPVAAGLMLAVLTAKPQLGLLVPVFLVSRGQWRTVLSACVGTAGLVASSLALFGADAWTAMAAQVGGPAADFLSENLYASMPTTQQYARFLGASADAAGAVQLCVIALGAAAVWTGRALPYRAHAALTLCAACAVLPYAWFYDWLPVMAAVLIAKREGLAPTPLLWAVWLVPFASKLQEAMLTGTPGWLALPLTNAVNLGEAAAVWGLIFMLVRPTLGTSALRPRPSARRAGLPAPPASA